MAESKIISFIISLWKTIVAWYEMSAISRAIDRMCDFFAKQVASSFFLKALKNSKLNVEWWTNSNCCRILGRLIPKKERVKVSEPLKSNIIDIVCNIYNLPMRTIGLGIICYSTPILLISAIFLNVSNILLSAALLLLGGVCFVFTKTPYQLFVGSRLLMCIGRVFHNGEYKVAEPMQIPLAPFLKAALILGAVGGAGGPILGTLIIVGVLFAAAVFKHYEIGVYATLCMAAFMPTAITAGLCVLSIIGFGIALYRGRIGKLKLSAIAPFLAIYILLGAASTLTSLDFKGSIFVYAVYLVFILMYVVLINTFTTKEKWRNAIITFAVPVFFVALYGILQNFTMGSTTQGWVDSNMFGGITTRVYATFDNPNVLGQYFIITMPMIFALYVYNKNNFNVKMTWLCVFAVSFLCLLYTWSRGAWVGVMLGVGLFLLVRDKRWIALAIVCILAMPFVLPDSIMNRLFSIGNTSDSSTAYRVAIWVASARVAVKYWVTGVGYGSWAFAQAYRKFAWNGAEYALHAHNFYIQLVTDVGIGGLITFFAITLTAYKEAALVKQDKFIKMVTLALAGTLTGYLFQGIAESMWYNLRMSLMFWIIIAFILSGSQLDRGSE